ncbi:MAG: acyltransferase [Streptosporangiales bacterium]|nr:acyltransferase [Streptosporangiales bacterium]
MKRTGARLMWLDALRGFAALCVVFDHTGYHVLVDQRNFVYQWFDPGQYGVFVFFLVSGYIIPASLERKGSMRGFWVSRLFRLYPLYLVAIVLSVVGAEHGVGSLGGAQHHPLTSIASWAVMIPDILLENNNIPNVVWTLSFEMVFYLLVACLYSWKKHKASGTYALGLGIGAVALGGIVPMEALYNLASEHGQMGLRVLCIGADVLIVGGIILSAVYSRKGGVVLPLGKIGATVAAATALILLFFNESYPFPFSGFVILALMFTGTLIYRMEQGEAPKVRSWAIVAAVFVLTMAAGLWHGDSYGTSFLWQWGTCLVATAITFGVGMACRNLQLPAWLPWLGVVSFSVYLLHPLVINVYEYYARTVDAGTGVQGLIFIGFIAVVLAVSACGYYWVEKPMVSLGRKFSRRVGG